MKDPILKFNSIWCIRHRQCVNNMGGKLTIKLILIYLYI